MSSNTTQIQITPENAEEFLEAASTAEQAAAGETPIPTEEPQEPQEAPAEEKPVDDLEIKPQSEEAEEAPADDGPTFSMEEVFDEYAQNGQLTDETNSKLVAALEGAGFQNAQGIIDQYIAGAQASVANMRSTAFDAAGGEQQYGQMVGWAAENLSPQQIQAFNAAVADPAMVDIAVRGLRAQFEAAGGSQAQASPRVEAGPNSTAASGTIPRSMVQVSDLVSDPQYSRDPAHKAEVDARIQRAIDLGYI